MATSSRYAPATAVNTAANTNPTGTATQWTSSREGSSTGTSNTSSVTQQNAANMDTGSLSVLNALIQQLMTGGTPAMQTQKAARDTELSSLTTQRQGYSKEAAFADAQGLIAQTMRQALEKLLPSINSAAMGAGASQSSMRALLTQRAAENAAQNASAAGLGAAVQYGGVANGMSGAIGQLLGQQDPATAALINALNIAKGATTSSTTKQDATVNERKQTSETGTTTENKQIQYAAPQYAGLPTTNMGSNRPSGFTYFGPVDTQTEGDRAYAAGRGGDVTTALLQELAAEKAFSGYSF